jgi:hypothetical protein
VLLVVGWLRDPATLAFVVAGGFCLWRCASVAVSRRLADRVGYGAHALMCGSMVAMVWFATPLVAWQMAVFALAGGWFAVQATGVRFGSLRLTQSGGGAGLPGRPDAAVNGAIACEGSRGGRARCAHHAVVMALMVWMLRSAGTGTVRMAGMVMPSRAGAVPLAGGGYCVAVAVLLVGAAAVSIARGRDAQQATVRDDVAHGLMTAGMAAMLFAMA